MQEKRRRLRIELALPAWIYVEGKRIKAQTENISLKGVLLKFGEESYPFKKGEKYTLLLSPGGGVEIKVLTKLVALNERGGAFDFLKMDEVSFNHLYNIIRLYAPDPDEVKAELLNPAFNIEELD
ncbi:MAG TPA: PilZ domain-containing protein [Desulfonauticus sp.]|jgi:hypothetical protein|nr:MAG: Type IV pilus assembly PilZ [Desulfonauticus sp. 38_4375]MDK2922527.1 hypothetical protein [Desulfonauticus sp.]HCO11726.1 PilZ domain-containing protein [Desulfonauticus sp.]